MNVAEKIKRLRKENDMCQAQLAEKIGADARRISLYENGKTLPGTDVLTRIAQAFNVSLDYLVKENVDNMATTPIRDEQLLKQFEEIDRMSEEEKAHIKFVIQAVIDKNRFKRLAQAV
jgi:transcriptional regulator with XRE-family HTH domain